MQNLLKQSVQTVKEENKAVEKRTSLKIACPEEIALHFGWITREKLQQQIDGMKGKYFEYLKKILTNAQ